MPPPGRAPPASGACRRRWPRPTAASHRRACGGIQPDGQADPVVGGDRSRPPLEVLADPTGRVRVGHERTAVQARQHRLGDLRPGAGVRSGGRRHQPGRRRLGRWRRPRPPAPSGRRRRPAPPAARPPRRRHPGHQVVQPVPADQGRNPTHPVASRALPAARRRSEFRRRRTHRAPCDPGPPARSPTGRSRRPSAGSAPIRSPAWPAPTPTSQPRVWAIGAERASAAAPPGTGTGGVALPGDAGRVGLLQELLEVLGSRVHARTARPHHDPALGPRGLQQSGGPASIDRPGAAAAGSCRSPRSVADQAAEAGEERCAGGNAGCRAPGGAGGCRRRRQAGRSISSPVRRSSTADRRPRSSIRSAKTSSRSSPVRAAALSQPVVGLVDEPSHRGRPGQRVGGQERRSPRSTPSRRHRRPPLLQKRTGPASSPLSRAMAATTDSPWPGRP